MNRLLSMHLNIHCVHRMKYTEDINKKPNNHCLWFDNTSRFGWYETDENLKKRMKDKLDYYKNGEE